jgi:hypothetical protein
MASENRRPESDREPRNRSAERVAFNDNIFREANEATEQTAAQMDTEIDQLPCICECAEESCTSVILVPRDDYARVRSDSRLFFNAPGHHVAAHGWGKVVERHAAYEVVEKLDRAGEIVEMLDDGRDSLRTRP